MKKQIIYVLLLIATCCGWACSDDGIEISDKYKSKTPKNVKLLEYGPTSLTICWDFIRGASSYTVQLTDMQMNPISEALCLTTSDIDYYEFTDLSTDKVYYGRVRANYPYSATSEWVYVTANQKPLLLMAGQGGIEINPALRLCDATNSTLTYEWAYTEAPQADAQRIYDIGLYRDQACTDLVVSWLANGALTSGKGLFTALVDYPVLRFTFAGLNPATNYYARVLNKSLGDVATPVTVAQTLPAGAKVTAGDTAKTGDIVLAQDFSKFIHGGDVVRAAAGYNAKSGSKYRSEWEIATGENPQAEGDRPLCNWSAEFHIHTGGTSAEYLESIGMTGWGSSGNISTRPGYVKCGGGGGGIGMLYTSVLSALANNTTVNISFAASAYTEANQTYGSTILVQAVEGAEFGANHVVSKPGTVIASKVIDISAAIGKFDTFTTTLEGLSPTSRLVFSSDPAQSGSNKTRFLLDDIVVTCAGESHVERLATPAHVKFDDQAIASDKLTLLWDAVTDATSYTIAYWAEGTPESEATLLTGIEATTLQIRDLTAETKYSAKVKACRFLNAAYDSAWSSTATATTLAANAGKLTAPANLTVTVDYSTAICSWDAVADATGYRITVNGASHDVTATTYTATDLAVGTDYPISVIALAANSSNNSDATTTTVKTLNVKIVVTTTSSIILEWEKAGSATQYTVMIEQVGASDKSAQFTYDWSTASGYSTGDIAFRFAFNYAGSEWPSALLSAANTYALKVKAGTADSENRWSTPISGTVKNHVATSGEFFYEDFDRFMGGDAVYRAAGVKPKAKVSSEAALSTMLTAFSYTDWQAGGGAINSGSGTYGDPYRLQFFTNESWITGKLGSSEVINAFCGCIRMGGDNTGQAYIQTPAMSALTTASAVTVRFKTSVNAWAAASTTDPAVIFKEGWARDQFEAMELYIVHADGQKEQVGNTISVGSEGNEFAWKSHSIAISNLLPTDKLLFTSVASKKSRYYLDEISIIK